MVVTILSIFPSKLLISAARLWAQGSEGHISALFPEVAGEAEDAEGCWM